MLRGCPCLDERCRSVKLPGCHQFVIFLASSPHGPFLCWKSADYDSGGVIGRIPRSFLTLDISTLDIISGCSSRVSIMKGRIDTMNTVTLNSDPPQMRAVDADAALTGKLCRFHSFRVLDADGQHLGLVDWIWADTANQRGEFIGVHLRWLRGSVLTIPAHGARVDVHSPTIQVVYTTGLVKRAPRFSIDRELTANQKQTILDHYSLQRTAVPGAVQTRLAHERVSNFGDVRVR